MGHSERDSARGQRPAWNAGRTLCAMRALKPQQVWAIRIWLDRERRLRDRALFDLAIDSKLRGCDVVTLRIGDLVGGNHVRMRATVMQRKTGRPPEPGHDIPGPRGAPSGSPASRPCRPGCPGRRAQHD